MIEKFYTIQNEVGLHARPASLLVKKAQQFKSNIEIQNKNKANTVNAKSILSLLSLGAKKGEQIVIRTDGTDEKEAMEEIIDTLETFKD